MNSRQCLFTYEIVLDDRLTTTRQRHLFMESIIRQTPELGALGPGVATDYASLIVTSARVELGLDDQKTFTLGSYDTDLPGASVTAPSGRPFKLGMDFLGLVKIHGS